MAFVIKFIKICWILTWSILTILSDGGPEYLSFIKLRLAWGLRILIVFLTVLTSEAGYRLGWNIFFSIMVLSKRLFA